MLTPGPVQPGDPLLALCPGHAGLAAGGRVAAEARLPAGPGNTGLWLVESCNTGFWLADQLQESVVIYTTENLQLDELSNSSTVTVNPLHADQKLHIT